MDTAPPEHCAYFKTNFSLKMSASSPGGRKNEGMKGSSRLPAELLSWKSWKLLSTFPSTAHRLPAASPKGWSEDGCSKKSHFPQEQLCPASGECPGWGNCLWTQNTGGRSREAWRGDGLGFAQRGWGLSIPGSVQGLGLRRSCPWPWQGVELNGFNVPSNTKPAVTPCLDLPCQNHHPGEEELCRKIPGRQNLLHTRMAGAPLGAPPPLDVAAGLGLLPGCTAARVSLVCHPCSS